MRQLSNWDWIAIIILVISGLNWGLVGIFNFNVVTAIFGELTIISRVIYTIIGFSAVYVVISIPTKLMKD